VTRLALRALLGLLLAVAVYAVASIYADVRALRSHLESFEWWRVAPVLGLTIAAYALRFAKWHLLLGRVQARVPVVLNLKIFLSGFSMGITPGKVGELIKAWMLRGSLGIPVSRTAPVVVADRLTDLVALLLLCLVGASEFITDQRLRSLLVTAGVFVAGATVVLGSRTLLTLVLRGLGRLPLVGGPAKRAKALVEPMTEVLRPASLAASTLVATLAWLGECLGFHLVLVGLPGVSVSVASSVFIYAASTVLGALSFLPGGLGVTEGGLTLLLVRSSTALSRAASVAATLLIRLCTLWFGVAVGLLALAWYRHGHRDPISPPVEQD